MCEINSENCNGARETEAEVGDLFSRAQGGDASAIEELVERHRDDVYGFLLRMTRSQTVAAELAGQSFLSTHLRLKELRSEDGYAAVLHRAAAECALRKSRAGTGKPATEERLESPDLHPRINPTEYSPIDWSRRAMETALSAELRNAIEQAADRLPPAQHEVFFLKDIAGLSYEEVAEINGHSVLAIKRNIHQARLSLREAIDRLYRKRLD